MGQLGIEVEDQLDGPVWAPGMDPLAPKPKRKGAKRKDRQRRTWWKRR
jgi:hypothetical protein